MLLFNWIYLQLMDKEDELLAKITVTDHSVTRFLKNHKIRINLNKHLLNKRQKNSVSFEFFYAFSIFIRQQYEQKDNNWKFSIVKINVF